MFRVFLENDEKVEFLTYNEFSAWRLKMAHKGYRPYYAFSVHIRCGHYIYCYQLRKIPSAEMEES